MQQTIYFALVFVLATVALAGAELTFDAKVCRHASTSEADCIKCCKDEGFNDYYTSRWTSYTTAASYVCQCGKDIPKLTDKRQYFDESRVDMEVCNYGYNKRNSKSCLDCCKKEGFNHGTIYHEKIQTCSCSVRTWLKYAEIKKRLNAGEKFSYVVGGP